jgi:hypothetical protein
MCQFIQYFSRHFQYFSQLFSISWGAFSTFRCAFSNRRGCIQYFSVCVCAVVLRYRSTPEERAMYMSIYVRRRMGAS